MIDSLVWGHSWFFPTLLACQSLGSRLSYVVGFNHSWSWQGRRVSLCGFPATNWRCLRAVSRAIVFHLASQMGNFLGMLSNETTLNWDSLRIVVLTITEHRLNTIMITRMGVDCNKICGNEETRVLITYRDISLAIQKRRLTMLVKMFFQNLKEVIQTKLFKILRQSRYKLIYQYIVLFLANNQKVYLSLYEH